MPGTGLDVAAEWETKCIGWEARGAESSARPVSLSHPSPRIQLQIPLYGSHFIQMLGVALPHVTTTQEGLPIFSACAALGRSTRVPTEFRTLENFLVPAVLLVKWPSGDLADICFVCLLACHPLPPLLPSYLLQSKLKECPLILVFILKELDVYRVNLLPLLCVASQCSIYMLNHRRQRDQ